MKLDRKRIRIKIDAGAKTTEKFKDVIANAYPECWRGNGLQFEIGIFFGTDILTDLSNIASLTVLVKTAVGETSTVISKTITSASLTACAAAAWTNGTGQHAIVTVPAGEMNIAANTYYMVVYVLTNDSPAEEITLGVTDFKVTEDGTGTFDTPAAASPEYYDRNASDARYIQKRPQNGRFRESGGELYFYQVSTAKWHQSFLDVRDGVTVFVINQTGVDLP